MFVEQFTSGQIAQHQEEVKILIGLRFMKLTENSKNLKGTEKAKKEKERASQVRKENIMIQVLLNQIKRCSLKIKANTEMEKPKGAKEERTKANKERTKANKEKAKVKGLQELLILSQ